MFVYSVGIQVFRPFLLYFDLIKKYNLFLHLIIDVQHTLLLFSLAISLY